MQRDQRQQDQRADAFGGDRGHRIIRGRAEIRTPPVHAVRERVQGVDPDQGRNRGIRSAAQQ